MSSKEDGAFKSHHQAVGIDRNDAAKPTERPERLRRMSRPMPPVIG